MSLIADLRHASRHLLRSPGYALAAVATLALAIGDYRAYPTIVSRLRELAQ